MAIKAAWVGALNGSNNQRVARSTPSIGFSRLFLIPLLPEAISLFNRNLACVGDRKQWKTLKKFHFVIINRPSMKLCWRNRPKQVHITWLPNPPLQWVTKNELWLQSSRGDLRDGCAPCPSVPAFPLSADNRHLFWISIPINVQWNLLV